MAVNLSLNSHEVSDLCLGKPALLWLPLSATIAVALKAFKDSPQVTEIAVWNCDQNNHLIISDKTKEECCCLGKISMVDIICFLSKDENLTRPEKALSSPVSAILPSIPGQVRQIDSHSSLMRGLDLMVGGAESLIVPISVRRKTSSARKAPPKTSVPVGISTSVHGGKEFCWITHEDVVRFLMGFIGVFSPLPSMSIEDLGLINPDVLQIEAEKPASKALNIIQIASHAQSAVAVVERDPEQSAAKPKLIGEISPCTLASCDETVALALATLSASDFVSYVNCGEPPESLIELIRQGISQKMNLNQMPDDTEEDDSAILSDSSMEEEDSASSFSSDDEFLNDSYPSAGKVGRIRSQSMGRTKNFCGFGYGSRSAAAGAPVTCRPWSSLIAVMVQALANRLNYMWVTDDDSSLIGIVSFWDILDLFLSHLRAISDKEN